MIHISLQTFFILLALSLIPSLAFSQRTQVDPTWETGSIENQFEWVIKGSNNYQDFKVIKQTKMANLKSRVLDTLLEKNDVIRSANAKIAEQQQTVSKLNTQLSDLQEELTETNNEKDSMSFLGMKMNKGAYQLFMWTLILGLGALAAFLFFRFQNAHSVTANAKKDLAELQEEFDNHRKRSLEREQKAMRKLQDALNKTDSGSKS